MKTRSFVVAMLALGLIECKRPMSGPHPPGEPLTREQAALLCRPLPLTQTSAGNTSSMYLAAGFGALRLRPGAGVGECGLDLTQLKDGFDDCLYNVQPGCSPLPVDEIVKLRELAAGTAVWRAGSVAGAPVDLATLSDGSTLLVVDDVWDAREVVWNAVVPPPAPTHGAAAPASRIAGGLSPCLGGVACLPRDCSPGGEGGQRFQRYFIPDGVPAKCNLDECTRLCDAKKAGAAPEPCACLSECLACP